MAGHRFSTATSPLRLRLRLVGLPASARLLSALLTGRNCGQAEAQGEVAGRRPAFAAARRPAVPGGVAPATTPAHPATGSFSANRIGFIAQLAPVEPIVTPLQKVAMDVK